MLTLTLVYATLTVNNTFQSTISNKIPLDLYFWIIFGAIITILWSTRDS